MFARLLPNEKTDPELAPFRPGLIFGFFNALAWQIGIGTPMVLFAERLGASTASVGLAYAFVFLLTPIQILSTALLPRLGFKRVTLAGWGTRSFFLAVPMLLALAAIRWGPVDWMAPTLVASVFFFCLFRAVGQAAFSPWLYAILPVSARGRYWANDQFVSAVAGTGTLLVSAALFALLPIYAALILQYALALAGSALSYVALKKLPDGPRPAAISLRSVVRDTPRHLFGPGRFRRYVWISVWFYVLLAPIPPFMAYYLKVGARLGAGQIMLFEVARFLGVIVSAWSIRRRIDTAGARPFFVVACALYAAVGVHGWLFLRGGFGGVAGVYAAYFTIGVGATCWTVANLHFLPKIVPDDERPLMVTLHGAVTAFLGGCAATAWGWFLKAGDAATGPRVDVAVFSAFFVFVIVSAIALAVLFLRLPEERAPTAEPLQIGDALLRPFRAATALINLVDPRKSPRPPGGSSKTDAS